MTLPCLPVLRRLRLPAGPCADNSDIQPLDLRAPIAATTPCRVHHARGALTQTNDFAPLETPLTLRQGGSTLQLAAGTGKSSTVHLPFFNLELGNGGILGAIGWTGGWAVRFDRQVGSVRVRAGMERTHLRQHPGEEIRTPRIDLETIARSVALWRSDLQCSPFDPIAMQAQTQGLAPWVPLSAAVCEAATPYAMRSALGPALVTHWSMQAVEEGAALPADTIRELMAEALAMRKYFYGDYYPLLVFSLAADAWAASQYDRPDLAEGMVVVFRRHESPFSAVQVKLKALDLEAEFHLYSWDDHRTWRMSGRTLMNDGLSIVIKEKSGAVLFVHKRA